MSDQQPPDDPRRWVPPPDPLTDPTRVRPGSDAAGDRPIAPAQPPDAPTTMPGPPPPPGPPAPPGAPPPPQPGWAPAPGPQQQPPGGRPQPPGGHGGFPPPSARRPAWPFALGGGVLVVLLVGVLVVTLLVRDGGGGPETAAGYYHVTYAAAPEDAELAWSQEASDGLGVGRIEQLGNDAVLAFFRASSSSGDEEDTADPQVVAYDMDGEERWQVSGDGLDWASPSLTGAIAIASYEDRLAGYDPDDGEELWSVDGDNRGVWEVDGSLVVSSDDPEQTSVVDLESGEELAEVDGILVASPGTDSFVTVDDETVRHVDLTGEELWSVTAGELDLEFDADRPPMASYGDGLIALSVQGDDEHTLVAVDPDSGEELWSETGAYRLQHRGVDGAVAAIRWEDPDAEASTEPRPGELVLFDADGERDAVEVEELSSWGLQGFMDVDGTGEFYSSYQSGTIIGADLEIVAAYDTAIADYTADGVYLQDDDELTLASWASEDELFTIEVEHDGRATALHGAVAVQDEESTEFGVYR